MNLKHSVVLLYMLLGFLALSFLLSNSANADNLYASIRGTVTDQSGAVLPDVHLTATNTATGVNYATVSNANGAFEFLQLPVGDYRVEGKKSGFSDFATSTIHLELGQVYQLNVQFKLGASTVTVTVEASAAQVNTTGPQLGNVVDSNFVVNIPLINRNWVNLQQLEPGVVAAADGRGDFSTNGSETQQNSYLINGTDTNDLPLNTPLIIPSPDAIQEFQMVTNVINPEYGRNSGAVINAITKSGSNEFHGDAFEFYRDTFLNARNYFAVSPQIFHQNEFGGTIGGPIWKNHTFIFFSYQGIRNREPEPGVSDDVAVFSQAQAGGDFSANVANLAGTNVAPLPLFGDAASPCPASGGSPCAAGTAYSKLFSTGVVPSQDINPLSAKLVSQFVPAPNAANNRFQFNPVEPTRANQYIGRIDEHIGATDTLWGSWFWQESPSTSTIPFVGATLPGFTEADGRNYNQGTISWTHVIGSNMLNEARVGYTRFNFKSVNPATNIQPSSYCASNANYVGGSGNMCFSITPQLAAGAQLPVVNVSGLFSLGFSSDGPQPRIDQTYQATDNFSITHGRHAMKLGFDMRRFEVFNPFAASNNGTFDFENSTPLYGTGISGLDFLLGIPGTYAQGSGATINARTQEYYSYFQDEYKIRPNLTLTYGLGWQIDTPYNDLFANDHSQIYFSPFQTSTLFPSAPVGVVYHGDPGIHPAGTTHWFRNLGPRLGFAYSPDLGWLSGGPGKLSIRGGYGIYYNRSEEEQVLQTLSAPPFSLNVTGATAAATGVKGASPTFANPYASFPIAPATLANQFPFTPPTPSPNINFSNFGPIFTGVDYQDAATRDPMSENFSLTIERQLPASTILSLGYVGAVAHHLTLGLPINNPTSPAAVQAYCAVPANAVNCGPGADLSLWQAAPQLFNYNPFVYGAPFDIQTIGNSRYNAFQVTVDKHMSHGLQLNLSYTWSHSIDNTSGFENSAFGGGGFGSLAFQRASNPYCAACDYGNSAFDAAQRVVISYVYQIPSPFKGGNFVLNRIFKGWVWSGITTFQSGFPLDVVDENLASGISVFQLVGAAAPDVPNITGPVSYGNLRGATHTWFNGSVFSQEATGTIGNLGRNSLHAPGFNNFDMGLYKDTQITERTKLQLRLETYNVFNHTTFTAGGIDNGFGDPFFGQEFGAAAPREFQLAAKFYF